MYDRKTKTVILAKAFHDIADAGLSDWRMLSDEEQGRFMRMADPFIELVDHAISLERRVASD